MIEQIKSKVSKATDLKEFCQKLIWGLSNEIQASQGAFFIKVNKDNINYLRFVAGYAYQLPDTQPIEFEFGDGLAGQVAKGGEAIIFSTVPDGYIKILSGLGKSTPTSLAIFPLKQNGEVIGVIELASFTTFGENEQQLFSDISSTFSEQLASFIAKK